MRLEKLSGPVATPGDAPAAGDVDRGRAVGRALVSRVLRFALVSGVGLGLDVLVFLALVGFGLRPGYANFISASLAVTFVYFVSTKRIFEYHGRFLFALFAAYLAYQALAVSAASWAVDAIVLLGALPVVAKGLILPVTFSANYLFLDFLTRTRR